jgi:uncharacterized protein (TIGR01777 family)
MGMTIAISGASGLVGSRLMTNLTTHGYTVRPMVRRETRNNLEIAWNPESGEIDATALESCQVVVHLAGENVASGRWTDERKHAIMESRSKGTRLLAETLSNLANKPNLFVSASAIGYYGNRLPDEICTEKTESGHGFLADVTRAWEAATAPAVQAGIRTVNLRIGVVLSPDGGALGRMLPIFKKALGGKIGDGRQMMSWISLEEIPRILQFLIDRSDIRGPVNAVSPNPVSNAHFTNILSRVLKRPAVTTVPPLVLKMAYGQMANEVLLGGAVVLPQVLTEHGYQFHQPDLEQALTSML